MQLASGRNEGGSRLIYAARALRGCAARLVKVLGHVHAIDNSRISYTFQWRPRPAPPVRNYIFWICVSIIVNSLIKVFYLNEIDTWIFCTSWKSKNYDWIFGVLWSSFKRCVFDFDSEPSRVIVQKITVTRFMQIRPVLIPLILLNYKPLHYNR